MYLREQRQRTHPADRGGCKGKKPAKGLRGDQSHKNKKLSALQSVDAARG